MTGNGTYKTPVKMGILGILGNGLWLFYGIVLPTMGKFQGTFQAMVDVSGHEKTWPFQDGRTR